MSTSRSISEARRPGSRNRNDAPHRALVETGNDAIFAIRHHDRHSTVIVVNNLSPERVTIELDIAEDEIHTATDLLADRIYEPLGGDGACMCIQGCGFRWIRPGGIY